MFILMFASCHLMRVGAYGPLGLPMFCTFDDIDAVGKLSTSSTVSAYLPRRLCSFWYAGFDSLRFEQITTTANIVTGVSRKCHRSK